MSSTFSHFAHKNKLPFPRACCNCYLILFPQPAQKVESGAFIIPQL